MKGTAIRSRLGFLEARFGEGARADALGALDERDQRALEVAMATSWLPVELVDRLDEQITRLAGGGLEVASEYGAFSARQNLSSVYRMFVDQARGDPQALLEGLAPLHASFYDEGSMRVAESGPGRSRVEIDFAGRAARFRCQVSLGFLEQALRSLQVPGLEASEVSCQARGAPLCCFELRWTTAP